MSFWDFFGSVCTFKCAELWEHMYMVKTRDAQEWQLISWVMNDAFDSVILEDTSTSLRPH